MRRTAGLAALAVVAATAALPLTTATSAQGAVSYTHLRAHETMPKKTNNPTPFQYMQTPMTPF
ncbi:hypothetical protein NOCD_21790, partial [Nocardioides cavernae]|uniref:hypothetical protein n=1 Tax=Nocardioides cavernae TaxID=1921566 RepID=UPI00200D9058